MVLRNIVRVGRAKAGYVYHALSWGRVTFSEKKKKKTGKGQGLDTGAQNT